MRVRRALPALALLLSLLLQASGAMAHGHPPRHWAPLRHYLPTLRVTGYDLVGYTASGVWTHPGTCASDWRYIPRGAYVHIPGIGTCRVEDTGGAIVGWRIDLWESSLAACYAVTGWYRHAYYWTT